LCLAAHAGKKPSLLAIYFNGCILRINPNAKDISIISSGAGEANPADGAISDSVPLVGESVV
jgi:hypothetical protein